MKYLSLISFLGLLFLAMVPPIQVLGQDSLKQDNPFELQDRLEKLKIEEEQKKESETQVNPFEIPKSKRTEPEFKPEVPSPEKKIQNKLVPVWKPVISAEKKAKTISDFWLGMYILMLGTLLAIMNTLFRSEIRNRLKAFSSENMMNLFFRQQGENVSNSTFLLHVFYLLCGGAFIYLIIRQFGFAGLSGGVPTLLLSLLFLALITVFRYAILYVIGIIFPFSRELTAYRFTISVFDNVISFVLFPFVIFIAFAPNKIGVQALFVALGILLLIYLYRSLRSLTFGANYFSLNKFHFFLYLCTVEIAPLVIIVKMITIWGSAV